jgi:hypothetical protein
MGNRNRRLGALRMLLATASLGCGLETSGIGGSDAVVEIGDDRVGDWVPADDADPPDDAIARDDVTVRDDAEEPDDDADGPPDGEDDAGGEDDGGPIPDGCAVEICNGLDDDCDGRPDDGFECAIGIHDICGPCGEGLRTCNEECVWSECTYALDVCAPGTVEECTPAACEVGHRTCEPDCRWTACVPDHSECTAGTTESCTIDSCGTGSRTCGTNCVWGGCRYECRNDWEDCCPGVGCVDLDWNDDHCGNCSTDCEFGSICWDGDCT